VSVNARKGICEFKVLSGCRIWNLGGEVVTGSSRNIVATAQPRDAKERHSNSYNYTRYA